MEGSPGNYFKDPSSNVKKSIASRTATPARPTAKKQPRKTPATKAVVSVDGAEIGASTPTVPTTTAAAGTGSKKTPGGRGGGRGAGRGAGRGGAAGRGATTKRRDIDPGLLRSMIAGTSTVSATSTDSAIPTAAATVSAMVPSVPKTPTVGKKRKVATTPAVTANSIGTTGTAATTVPELAPSTAVPFTQPKTKKPRATKTPVSIPPNTQVE